MRLLLQVLVWLLVTTTIVRAECREFDPGEGAPKASLTPYFYFDCKTDIFDEANRGDLQRFSAEFAQFLATEQYKAWPHDKGWRLTAPMRVLVTGFKSDGKPNLSVEHRGPHPIVRLYYSPGVYRWLESGKKGAIPDGEIIIKEQVPPKDVAEAVVEKLQSKGTFPKPGEEFVVTRNAVIPDRYVEDVEPEGYPSMIKFKEAAHDGWLWGDWGLGHNYPYYGRSAYTVGSEDTDENIMPADAGTGWFNNNNPDGYEDPPSYPTGSWAGTVVYPMDGFGAYCLNCHASAQRESTFSDLANIEPAKGKRPDRETAFERIRRKLMRLLRLDGADDHVHSTMDFPLIVRYAPDKARRAGPKEGGVHSDGRSDDPQNHKYTKLRPLEEPNETFKQTYDRYFEAPVTWQGVWNRRFPAQTYDHVVAKRHKDKEGDTNTFLTADQCSGCHAAAGTGAVNPANMEFPHASKDTLSVDLSPFGEWQTSLMGLAGRDPVFFSQVQSEMAAYSEFEFNGQANPDAFYGLVLDTCLYCHGAMGRRQWSQDGKAPVKLHERLEENAAGETEIVGALFSRQTVNAYPYDPIHKNRSKYGSLAREGISCMVCHTMDGAQMGVAEDENGVRYFKGTSTFSFDGSGKTIYGPYEDEDIQVKPMEQALGITPRYGPHLKKSQLCGSCHVVRLPVLQAGTALGVRKDGGSYVVATADDPGDDVDQRKVTKTRSDALGYGERTYEQTTYFEWQNSIYNDELETPSSKARSCQSCHMPQTYHGRKLRAKIANVQDTDMPGTHGRLPSKEVTLSPKDRFSRHSLNGINVFVLEMFQQFPLLLGSRQTNYLNYDPVQGPFLTARERMVDFARNESATVKVLAARKSETTLTAEVEVTNLAGHFFPSGVSFRRAFLEFLVLDAQGRVLWGSGRTNEIGELVGNDGEALPSENLDGSHQNHHQTITRDTEVQVYEEVVQDTNHAYTTSFLGIAHSVKDNRLRPKDFKTKGFTILGVPADHHLESHGTEGDPDYHDDTLWGGDRIKYEIGLDRETLRTAKSVRATLYYQSLPPRYLKDKFDAAQRLEEKWKENGGGDRRADDIRRLFFLVGHLNTGTGKGERSPIPSWKLEIAAAEKDL